MSVTLGSEPRLGAERAEAIRGGAPEKPTPIRSWLALVVMLAAWIASGGAQVARSVDAFGRPVHAGHELAARLRGIAEVLPVTIEFHGRPAPVVVRFVTYPEAFQPFAQAVQDETTNRRANQGAQVLMLAQQLLAPRLLTLTDLTGIPHHVLGYYERPEDVPAWPPEAGFVPVFADQDGIAVWRAGG